MQLIVGLAQFFFQHAPARVQIFDGLCGVIVGYLRQIVQAFDQRDEAGLGADDRLPPVASCKQRNIGPMHALEDLQVGLQFLTPLMQITVDQKHHFLDGTLEFRENLHGTLGQHAIHRLDVILAAQQGFRRHLPLAQGIVDHTQSFEILLFGTGQNEGLCIQLMAKLGDVLVVFFFQAPVDFLVGR